MKKYPQFITPGKERCAFLPPNGIRCRAGARIEDTYHGENELYDDYQRQATWARIAFCEKHFAGHDPEAYKKLVASQTRT